MLAHAIAAERIKLLTTKSAYWCSGIVVLLGLGLSILLAWATNSDGGDNTTESDFVVGTTAFGVTVLMIMAVLAVTSEFRFGTIRTSFQAIPQRSNLLYAKAAVYGGLSALLTFVLTVISLPLAKSISGSDLALFGSDAVRMYWGVPLYTFLSVLIGLGLGALIRQTAGAIVILLVWSLVLEGVLSVIPKVGDAVGPFLPFLNGSHFIDDSDMGIGWHWNGYGSLIYFMVFAAVVFGAGVLVTDRRDA
ncbi:ABC transporter permease [Williamsia sp.]|uniref:ABC transporter permease n=1 Tax=Williamsia sp. TaxID=1872085 RepID=UPI002F945FEA